MVEAQRVDGSLSRRLVVLGTVGDFEKAASPPAISTGTRSAAMPYVPGSSSASTCASRPDEPAPA